MRTSTRLIAWLGVAAVLVGLAVPWFLWGSDAVVAGLPVWVWWHAGWLCLTALAFWAFARLDWGLGVEVSGDG